MAKQRATIRDVATRAGVSVATASKAINDRYGVAADTVRRVHEAVADLGYESSIVARSMRMPRTGVIGILVWDIEPYSAEVLKGAAQALRDTDYELLVYAAAGRSADRMGWENRHLPRLSGTLIDGAVLVTPTVERTPGPTPVVAVDSHIGEEGLPAVDSDNFGGARLATDHLLGLGHRRIGFLGRPPRELESGLQREHGYRASLAAAGVPFDPDLVRAGGYGATDLQDAARALLELPHPPTAIFAANDVSAIATIDVALTLGLDVPRDLSVVGFDNVPESALCRPALTTVEQPLQLMGQRAVEMLLAVLAGDRLATSQLRLPTRLVARDSTAAPVPAAGGPHAGVHARPVT
ncbi:LacI family DNA-binding transcriptional regulator [Pseudonocardia sp. CA-107938]|uniref:LacI family DNA-binding transcriptional regulator n=1 Tax=Pseudonocardia sp. CA-107938 TaxID=3240021 RepID=UPI003D8EFCB4